MRIGTKILLLMLAITVGAAGVVTWVVTLNVRAYETERANDQISLAISRYVRHLDDQYQQTNRIVRAMLEAPAQRSLVQAAASDAADAAAREQLKLEVLGHDVQTELRTREGEPAFHVLVSLANEVLVVASKDPDLEKVLASDQVKWPADTVLSARGTRPLIQYLATAKGLFLAMGVPLRTQLDQPPDNAYFVGYRVDSDWVKQQLLADRMRGGAAATALGSTTVPLAAWFVMGNQVVAAASSDPEDTAAAAFTADTTLAHVKGGKPTTDAAAERVQFDVNGEHFLGQTSNLDAANPKVGKLVLASSLDRALAPLRRVQNQIFLTAIALCAVAAVICQIIAWMIARPINELVNGTKRIAAGEFDRPVRMTRRDELGVLADRFNEMAQGLKERDVLRDERTKIERDLALARKIQMDVLPKELPPCRGYDMAAFSLPAEATGGDIYDLVAMALDPMNPEASPPMVVLLADATGHGMGPALSVTQVRAMLRIGVRLRAELDHVFSQINRQLCQDLGSERFVTAFLGLLDPSAHHITYHSAGQAPLLHFHAEDHRFEWLDSSMIPLGIDEDARSDGARPMLIAPGDLIILLTDGFFEYQNANEEQFGRERVAEIIMQHHHKPARMLMNEILSATMAFAGGAPQLDDMTALIIRRLPAEGT